MTKKAPRGIPPRPQSAAPAFDPENPAAWINPEATAAPAAVAPRSSAPAEPMKRLTFDIPARLHRRIKADCALKGVDMAAELRRIMAQHFPEDTDPSAR